MPAPDSLTSSEPVQGEERPGKDWHCGGGQLGGSAANGYVHNECACMHPFSRSQISSVFDCALAGDEEGKRHAGNARGFFMAARNVTDHCGLIMIMIIALRPFHLAPSLCFVKGSLIWPAMPARVNELAPRKQAPAVGL